jgi:hypothetical protein
MQLDLDLAPRHPPICCMYCNKEVPQPFWVVKHVGRMTQQFVFCDEEHANEWYLERLRSTGL